MTVPVQDDEVILRHIPGGTLYQGPPTAPRLTSRNFEVRNRPDGTPHRGLSVSRFPPTSPAALIARVSRSPAESRMAAARVADVRALGLEVIADEIPPTDTDVGDPGHALIVSASATLADKTVRGQLAKLFQFLPPSS